MKKTSSIKTFAGLVSAALIVACSGGADDKDVSSQAPASSDAQGNANYSFFVAGHQYGTPQVNPNGLYQPFERSIQPLIGGDEGLKFGVFTGDVVLYDTTENWTMFQKDAEQLGIPYFVAAGNHDTEKTAHKDFIRTEDYAFEKYGDHFVVLNNSNYSKGVSPAGVALIEAELASLAPEDKIFIFMHHIAWKETGTSFGCIDSNPVSSPTGTENFLDVVLPLLKSKPNEAFVFAGDTGAFLTLGPSYAVEDNVTLLSGGMGGGNGNYFTVDVNNDEVDVNLKWLFNETNPAFSAVRNKEIASNSVNLSDYDDQCMTVRSADESRTDFDASATTIYKLEDDNFSLLNLTRMSQPGEPIRMGADNDNPIVLLSGLPIKNDMDYIMRLQFESSVESRGGLFLSQLPPKAPPSFDIARQIRFDTERGNNTHYIDFNGSDVGTKLRIDPISEAGTIDLQNIEIREVPRFGR